MTDFAAQFDPDTFVLGGFLEGRRGRVKSPKFTTIDYNGTVDHPVPGLELVIERLDENDEVDGERTEFYTIGNKEITEDGEGFKGTLNKGCRAAKFFNALKESKFDFKLVADGISGLEGTIFTWKHLPIKNSDNTFAVPASYENGGSEQSQEDVDFEEFLGTLVKQAVADGPVKKAQLGAKIRPALDGHPNQTKGLTKVASDSFLNSIEGVVVEAGSVRLG